MDDVTPEQIAALKDEAGEVGAEFAGTLAEKVTSAIGGFPSSSRRQRAAIAALVANGILDWAEAHADARDVVPDEEVVDGGEGS